MGKPARDKEGEVLAKIVRDYPLSPYVAEAKKMLKDLEMPIPEADPRAVAHMKYEMENRTRIGLISRDTQFLKRGPDTSMAAKSGMPTMTNPKQSVPMLVPTPASTAAANAPPSTGVNDVTIAPVENGASALDTKPDARPVANAAKVDPTAPELPPEDPNAPKAAAPATPASPATPNAAGKAAPTDTSKSKKKDKKKKTTKTDQTNKTTSSQE